MDENWKRKEKDEKKASKRQDSNQRLQRTRDHWAGALTDVLQPRPKLEMMLQLSSQN